MISGAAYHQREKVAVYHGDCLDVLGQLEPGSISAVVTDPPYGLKFMGKEWDHGVPGVPFWESILRVCKPGAHLLAFGGTRTHHRLMCAIEDAGWQIRDCLMWLYGSGFPKSLDVSKAIDKAAGAEREVMGVDERFRNQTVAIGGKGAYGGVKENKREFTAPATDAAKTWHGYGTALKPSYEPVVLAMKPLDGTFANNAIEHGVAGINVDGCRVGTDGGTKAIDFGKNKGLLYGGGKGKPTNKIQEIASGRFPANVIHDGSEEVVGLFPEARSSCGGGNRRGGESIFDTGGNNGKSEQYFDSGSAARFFYCAKASKKERGEGNTHPTVKPLALMRYLVKLVMPPGGIVLDPFMGSGSTLLAAMELGHEAIGIDSDEDSCRIAVQRIEEDQTWFS